MISFLRKISKQLLSKNWETRNLAYYSRKIGSNMIVQSSPFRDSIWVEKTILQSPLRAFRYGI